MTSSNVDNSILITGTEVMSTIGVGEYAERIIKINTEDHSVSDYLLPGESAGDPKDGVIVGDKFLSVGARNTNIYDLSNLNSTPSNIEHAALNSVGSFYHHSTAVMDNDVFIVGAYGLNDLGLGKKIFRLNHSTSTFTEFASLPDPVAAAGSAIVDGNLYIFGGSDIPYGELPTKRIYRVNIENPSDIEMFTMNEPMDFTFVQKHEHLIYIAGMIQDIEGGLLIGRRSSIGVFNTLDKSYQEINTNLDTEANGLSSVIQMCILKDKMYIIYGRRKNY